MSAADPRPRRPNVSYRTLRTAAEFVVAVAFVALAYGCWAMLP